MLTLPPLLFTLITWASRALVLAIILCAARLDVKPVVKPEKQGFIIQDDYPPNQ